MCSFSERRFTRPHLVRCEVYVILMAGDHQSNIKRITKQNIHKTGGKALITDQHSSYFLNDSQFYTTDGNNDSSGWENKLKHTNQLTWLPCNQLQGPGGFSSPQVLFHESHPSPKPKILAR